MKIAITGHRPNKLNGDYNLTGPLVIAFIRPELQKIIDTVKPTLLISGMALGIDTLWAQMAIDNKIPFLAALPCWEQDSQWPNISRSRYHSILKNPLCTTHFVHEGYYNNFCMQKRNEYMVNACDFLIAVWDGTPGGTANCLRYAEQTGRFDELDNLAVIKIDREKWIN